MTFPVLVLGLLACVGLLGVLVGLRDRRLGGRPACRRCGYRLAGHPDRCSECGTLLLDARTIRREDRLADGWIILTGLALAAPSLLFLAYIGMESWQARTTPVNWNTFKTDSMLVGDLSAASPSVVDSARASLMQRIGDGAVSSASVSAAVEHALTMQADRSVQWDEAWGDLIMSARDAGLLTRAQESRYVREGCRVTLDARDRVRPGDPIRLGIRCEARLGSTDRRLIQIDVRDVCIDGRQRIEHIQRNVIFTAGFRDIETRWVAFLDAPGPYVIDATLGVREYTLTDASRRSSSESLFVEQMASAFLDPGLKAGDQLRWKHFGEQFVVVPEGEPDVMLVTSESQAEDVAGSVTLSLIKRPTAAIRVEVDQAPVSLAMKVGMPTPDGMLELGRFTAGAGERGVIEIPAQDLAAFHLVDLVLTPDSDAARTRPGLEQIWGQSLTFEGLRFDGE